MLYVHVELCAVDGQRAVNLLGLQLAVHFQRLLNQLRVHRLRERQANVAVEETRSVKNKGSRAGLEAIQLRRAATAAVVPFERVRAAAGHGC
jgi:hypothetical protein